MNRRNRSMRCGRYARQSTMLASDRKQNRGFVCVAVETAVGPGGKSVSKFCLPPAARSPAEKNQSPTWLLYLINQNPRVTAQRRREGVWEFGSTSNRGDTLDRHSPGGIVDIWIYGEMMTSENYHPEQFPHKGADRAMTNNIVIKVRRSNALGCDMTFGNKVRTRPRHPVRNVHVIKT